MRDLESNLGQRGQERGGGGANKVPLAMGANRRAQKKVNIPGYLLFLVKGVYNF